MSELNLTVTKKQRAFLEADAFEVLYGGAAGGGKTYGQLVDALVYAVKYPKSKQLFLRKTYPELEKSALRVAREMYPQEIAAYNEQKHTYYFKNGSVIDFGYLQRENDVYKYQSAEYDVIRFDELTHFPEFVYTYMMSRIRSGANDYPKAIKSSTNPGGIGHVWVKERFIDPAPPGEKFWVKEADDAEPTSRIFIPAKVEDNRHIMENDPHYVDRLKRMSRAERLTLYEGRWDVLVGTYFDEWNESIHVVKPFPVPDEWRKYVAIDYGLDMLAALMAAVDDLGNVYIIREVYESGLVISDAARRIQDMVGGEFVDSYIAPSDLEGRSTQTGKSQIDIFREHGIPFTTVKGARVDGWLNVKEWLKPVEDGDGGLTSRLKVFEQCRNLIRTLPALQRDEKKVSDVATDPHELTHAPDALRYLLSTTPKPGEKEDKATHIYYTELESFINYGGY